MDNERGEILSLVGSADFFDSHHSGQVSGVTALRQPGSALNFSDYSFDGIAVMLWAFGPGIILLFLYERHRKELQQNEKR